MFFTKPYADALIVLLIVLLFFGPKRLPALGRSLGDGLREFKDSIGGKHDEHPELESAAANTASQPEPVVHATAQAAERQGSETSSESGS
jgi:sec-independent protein translocase protein TatA